MRPDKITRKFGRDKKTSAEEDLTDPSVQEDVDPVEILVEKMGVKKTKRNR